MGFAELAAIGAALCVVWLLALAVVVAVCFAAKRGDEQCAGEQRMLRPAPQPTCAPVAQRVRPAPSARGKSAARERAGSLAS